MNIIDNRYHNYITTQLQCGISARCHPQLFIECPEFLNTLHRDLSDCFHVLPTSVHHLLQRTNIWVNITYHFGLSTLPTEGKLITTHHHKDWLIMNRDNPEKVLGIEIYNASEYMKLRLHWNGYGLILHELCHLIHQVVLIDGLHNKQVQLAYHTCLSSGKYNSVLRRDWAGLSKEKDTAYATINAKEFFAEISVAFLSTGYPQLDDAWQGTFMNQSSPPFLDPMVLHRVCTKPNSSSLRVEDEDKTPLDIPYSLHCCNKFFPFTRGQLKNYDPPTFTCMEDLWFQISTWEDPLADTKDEIMHHDGYLNHESSYQVIVEDTVDL